MTYGGECWAIRKCEQNQMNTTEMNMLRWIQGKTRKYHIRNVTIREKVHINPINTFLMKKRLSWFGHVQRRDDDNIAKSVQNTRIDGSRPRGRHNLRWMDRLKDNMKKNNIRPEWASDRESLFNMVKNVNPTQETSTLHRKRQPYPGNVNPTQETSTLPRKRRKGEKNIKNTWTTYNLSDWFWIVDSVFSAGRFTCFSGWNSIHRSIHVIRFASVFTSHGDSSYQLNVQIQKHTYIYSVVCTTD